MRRSPLKRKTPMSRGKAMPRQSAKRRAVSVERRALVARLLEERPNCEACSVNASVDIHEKLTRGRGGSILDESNCLAVCRVCHDWIHAHPREAEDLGLLVSGRGAPSRFDVSEGVDHD